MKRIVTALLAAAALCSLTPAEAAIDDAVNTASGVAATTGIVSIATPILAGDISVAGGKQVVRIVDATGRGLTELTSDVLDTVSEAVPLTSESTVAVHVGKTQKTIPLVVRKDYLELNQPVTGDPPVPPAQPATDEGANHAASPH